MKLSSTTVNHIITNETFTVQHVQHRSYVVRTQYFKRCRTRLNIPATLLAACIYEFLLTDSDRGA
jgi:hypothetical protein